MEPGFIPVLQYVAEAKALVESDKVEKNFDRLEEEVDPLTSTSSSYLHPQLEVKMTQETYGCEFCTKSFSTKNLQLHITMFHTGEKPYSCFHCIKSFAKLSRLQNHLQVHTRVKPFCCIQCSKLFGQKSFSCFHCTKLFTHFSHLQNHLKVHTGVKPYNCTSIRSRFAKKLA